MDVEQIKPILYTAEGVFTGIGVNYLWEALRLPGYGVDVGIPPIQGPVNLVGIGVDDIIIAATGATISVYGWRTDSKEMIFLGAGIVGGLALTKVLEAYGKGAIQSQRITRYVPVR